MNTAHRQYIESDSDKDKEALEDAKKNLDITYEKVEEKYIKD